MKKTMPKRKLHPYDACETAREVWDLSLRRRIEQLDTRFHRHDEVEQTPRLDTLLPGILARKQRYESRLYENLTDEQRAIVDRMTPWGKVWAWARSNKEFH